MDLMTKPVDSLSGIVTLPASKSYSIRAFLIAACGGRSRIKGPSDCDDARVAINAARKLGARISAPIKDVWAVRAADRPVHPRQINVKESGTVLRFLLPLLALNDRPCLVSGSGTLRGRPNRHLTEVLRRQGVRIKGTGKHESIPIRLSGGCLRAGKISIRGDLSSQFISALLIACPQLNEKTTVVVHGRQMVSSDYILMTRQVLERSGIRLFCKNQRTFLIPGGQQFKGLGYFAVPSDYGLAAFLLAAGALTHSRILLRGEFQDDLVQADGRILDFLRVMGVQVKKTRTSLKIQGPFRMQGKTFSLKDCPDLVPIMAVLALFARGVTRLKHIRHARVKESNRISDLRRELLKLGVRVQEKENELIIHPLRQDASLSQRQPFMLDSYHDHRLAMAWSVLGLKYPCRVKNIECVSKSYPGFVVDLKSLGARVARGQ